eukprot:TRINITY_DN25195_c0_g1_i1.p1 TRINITY_DN25195_c0_g1~~TRINITY_DN25195_c0_g1_i1.p1  ORF type:complete len:298 (+),score=56.94 TRINITY_DN25195_c0_g1_i1:42-896(+)
MARPLRPKDKLVQELLKIAIDKPARHTRKRCVVAGTKLVRDLGQRHHFRDLLSLRAGDPSLEGLRAEARHVAEERSLRKLAQLKSFDGLVGTLDLPEPSKDLGDVRLLLCLEHVKDPGVLGTLLRTAMALQWQAAFLLPGCADPFEALCIRASQGALFDLPFARGTHRDLRHLCKQKGLELCVSHGRGADIGAPDYVPPKRGIALLLREEYNAPSAPPREATKITVPDPLLSDPARGEEDPFDARALDVAVAGGILMHHIRTFHFADVSRSAALASPAPSGKRR